MKQYLAPFLCSNALKGSSSCLSLLLDLSFCQQFFIATWNLLAKRVQGDASFIWFYDVLALVIFAPFVVLFVLFSHTSFSIWDMALYSRQWPAGTRVFSAATTRVSCWRPFARLSFSAGNGTVASNNSCHPGFERTTYSSKLMWNGMYSRRSSAHCVEATASSRQTLSPCCALWNTDWMLYRGLYIMGQNFVEYWTSRPSRLVLRYRLYTGSCLDAIRATSLARNTYSLAASSARRIGHRGVKCALLHPRINSFSFYSRQFHRAISRGECSLWHCVGNTLAGRRRDKTPFAGCKHYYYRNCCTGTIAKRCSSF